MYRKERSNTMTETNERLNEEKGAPSASVSLPHPVARSIGLQEFLEVTLTAVANVAKDENAGNTLGRYHIINGIIFMPAVFNPVASNPMPGVAGNEFGG
jgi:hypothetical protein